MPEVTTGFRPTQSLGSFLVPAWDFARKGLPSLLSSWSLQKAASQQSLPISALLLPLVTFPALNPSILNHRRLTA